MALPRTREFYMTDLINNEDLPTTKAPTDDLWEAMFT